MGGDHAQQRVGAAVRAVFDQYEHKHIISLPSRTDRRVRLQQEFAALGISLETAGIQWFDGLGYEDAAGFPNAGVRGCFNSHLTLLKQCASLGSPMLIMEDDIHLNLRSPATWEAAVAPRGDWDIIYYGYIHPTDIRSEERLAAFDGTTIGGHFYGINPGFAAAMAEFMEACLHREPGDARGGPMYRDGAFNHYRIHNGSVQTLLAVPTLATQFSSRSDLVTEHPFYDRIVPLRPLVNTARRIKSRLVR